MASLGLLAIIAPNTTNQPLNAYSDVWFVLLFWVGMAIIGAIAKGVKLVMEILVERTSPCPHGVRGGRGPNMKCPDCRAEAEVERIRILEREKELEERRKIQAKVDKVMKAEVERLTRVNVARLDYLLSLSPEEFETAVAVLYQKLGYEVKQTPLVGDRGKDAILVRFGQKSLLECKRYGIDKLVGRPHLQKLFAAMHEENASRGIVATTGKFARTAQKYASANSIELIDGEALAHMMSVAFPEDSSANHVCVVCGECGDKASIDLGDGVEEGLCRNGHKVCAQATIAMISPNLLKEVPLCVRCGKEMRVRGGRYGKFWGCTGYPRCTYTRPF